MKTGNFKLIKFYGNYNCEYVSLTVYESLKIPVYGIIVKKFRLNGHFQKHIHIRINHFRNKQYLRLKLLKYMNEK